MNYQYNYIMEYLPKRYSATTKQKNDREIIYDFKKIRQLTKEEDATEPEEEKPAEETAEEVPATEEVPAAEEAPAKGNVPPLYTSNSFMKH